MLLPATTAVFVSVIAAASVQGQQEYVQTEAIVDSLEFLAPEAAWFFVDDFENSAPAPVPVKNATRGQGRKRSQIIREITKSNIQI